MYNQIFTIAAIFAINASAQDVDVGSCDDPDYQCTLYNDPNFNEAGGYYNFCLFKNFWGDRKVNIGYSFLTDDVYGDFTNANMESYQCGAKVKAEFCSGTINAKYNQETGITEWSCEKSWHVTDAGEENAQVGEYKNLTNGVILRAAEDVPPPTSDPSCKTTIFSSDHCNLNYIANHDEKYEMGASETRPLFTQEEGFVPRSILMAEKTQIFLYSQPRLLGDNFEARNTFQIEEGKDQCVCMTLTDQDGEAFAIESFSFINHQA